jgi:hypothetical protein
MQKIIIENAEARRVMQALMHTTGYVVDAIRTTNGIGEIRQAILHSEDNENEIVTFLVRVKPKAGINVYNLARLLSQKISKAKEVFGDIYRYGWVGYVNYSTLFWDDEYDGGGVGKDVHGDPTISIKITQKA